MSARFASGSTWPSDSFTASRASCAAFVLSPARSFRRERRTLPALLTVPICLRASSVRPSASARKNSSSATAFSNGSIFALNGACASVTAFAILSSGLLAFFAAASASADFFARSAFTFSSHVRMASVFASPSALLPVRNAAVPVRRRRSASSFVSSSGGMYAPPSSATNSSQRSHAMSAAVSRSRPILKPPCDGLPPVAVRGPMRGSSIMFFARSIASLTRPM